MSAFFFKSLALFSFIMSTEKQDFLHANQNNLLDRSKYKLGVQRSTSLGIKGTFKVVFLSPSLRWWIVRKVSLSVAGKAALSCPLWAGYSHPGLRQLLPGLFFFICARVRSSVISALMGMRDGRQWWGRTSQREPFKSVLCSSLWLFTASSTTRVLILFLTG